MGLRKKIKGILEVFCRHKITWEGQDFEDRGHCKKCNNWFENTYDFLHTGVKKIGKERR